MDLKQCLIRLSSAPGTGGQTHAAVLARQLLEPLCDEVRRDALGSVIGIRRCGMENAPMLMLEAHIDEVGFVVTEVDGDGFVKVSSCGRADVRALPAAQVIVYGEGGEPYPGVFACTPPHLTDEKTRGALPDLHDMVIDTGMSGGEAQKHIRPGDRAGFVPNAEMINPHRICGKSLDDRAGVAAVLYAMFLLKEAGLKRDIAAVFAVQEELGCRGSGAAAFGLCPDEAIAVDVSFAHTPDADAHKCGVLGGGPMLGISPVLDSAVTAGLAGAAKEQGIPLQNEVMGGDTGTDADAISGSGAGVRTGLLSIPLRYMHTPVELADIRDVENTARLMAAYAMETADDGGVSINVNG